MSRIAKNPIELPKAVQFNQDGQVIKVKGPNGELQLDLHPSVEVANDEGVLTFAPAEGGTMAMAGTMRALVNNMVIGVTDGFEKKLNLIGVGYRAQAQGNKLNLQLGFSHPVEFDVPQGVTVETPSQTEIVVKGADKQMVGQVAAKIRGYRPPEPYKGKGVRYANERVVMKEAKKA
ncbi:50S ribosomal protein L6 [Wenzhouxiangella sp. XN79A]|uniref:50S ribosomal protein L6 n=1 Tax=Wenzhouxiangella sp. XN79A TaxID=2724193 RepID=UPI00144ADCFE|nr:50S ribosomal protein L6 [Wenzhouxiangella sp. XN79A]NKI33765.1 50S ribosomal protein L6 [Wenzhouxiangella sp. XN79A]